MTVLGFSRTRLGGGFGILAACVWTGLYLISATTYGGYDITRNYLSDLGQPAAPGAWAFNAACILAGLLFLPFALGLFREIPAKLGSGSVVLFLSAIALVLVGVFPEESLYQLHFYATLSFFLLLAASAAILAVPLYRLPRFGPPAGLMAALTVVAALAFLGTGGVPLLEHITVCFALLFTLVISASLLKKA
jgi:hypothetical membrane protein